MRRFFPALLRLAICCFAGPMYPAVAAAADPVVLAAGDIAECGSPGAALTAGLLAAQDGPILAVGDLAYDKGTAREFAECYEPSWGRFKARTYPVPGNHEYHSAGAAPYFAYWGARAAAPGGYYSVDLGAWHIVAINSNLGGAADRAQLAWLAADLKQSPAHCKLAFFHHPIYSSGFHGATLRLTPLLRLLHRAHVTLALTGHDHHYERFAPLDAAGNADPQHGLRVFVVGTGGATLYPAIFGAGGSEARQAAVWGVLRLTLHLDSYDWAFLAASPTDFRDAGHAACSR